MSMIGQYIVVGTFASEKDDIILGYFDNYRDAKEFESQLESDNYGDYCDLEFTYIYKLEVAEV